MTSSPKNDWNPETYSVFRGLRLRPALDLLMQVGTPSRGDVVDLGCGDGAMAGALRARFPKRQIVGVDASPAMLAKARGYDALVQADVALWQPKAAPGLIFSNAVLQWLPDHTALMPRLAGLLDRGGVLAVQMPDQQMAPSHASLRQVAQRLFPDRFDFANWRAPVAAVEEYYRLLAPLGSVNIWQTTYIQRLDPVPHGHPVRHFTQSTAMRPISDGMTPADLSQFIAAYEQTLLTDYPAEPDGSVLFPFHRLFFVLTI